MTFPEFKRDTILTNVGTLGITYKGVQSLKKLLVSVFGFCSFF